jgi:hypothetical protein
MTLFDILKSIYTKTQINIQIDAGTTIVLNRWLSYDKDNVEHLKRILPYFYYLTPQNYYDLLFFNIPKKQVVPFLRKIEKTEKPVKEDKVLERIQYLLDWSQRELNFNRQLLLKQIEPDRKIWEMELGLK